MVTDVISFTSESIAIVEDMDIVHCSTDIAHRMEVPPKVQCFLFFAAEIQLFARHQEDIQPHMSNSSGSRFTPFSH